MAGPAPIPAPKSDDDEDVSWALSTATALWGRGESAEALKWLRRAAETASDANRDLRAVELFKAAADLANEVGRPSSVAPEAPPQASTPPPPPVRPSPSTAPPAAALPPTGAAGPEERAVAPSRRPPPPPQRRAGSMPGESQAPPPMPVAAHHAVSPQPVSPQPVSPSTPPPARPGSIPPRAPSHVPPSPSVVPHVLTAVAPLVSPAGRPLQNLPQRKQPVIVPPVVASASAALRRGSMPSIPAVPTGDRGSIPLGERVTIPEPKIASTTRDSVHDDPPTKQMTPQQAASLSRRARTASRTKGLMSLSHGGGQQKERTRTKTERGERSASAIDSAAPEPTPSAARTLKRAVSESTDEMPAPPADVIAAAAAAAGARRPRREDEITVVRPPFPKPDAARAAELATLAGSFDDEQTNVLGGDESFVDLGSQKAARAGAADAGSAAPAPSAVAATAPAAAGTQPSRGEPAAAEAWPSFRVGLALDATNGGIRVVDAKNGAAVAFLVPSDAKSAEAIASWLQLKTWPNP